MFKYDLHVHTSEVSPCGRLSGKEMVDLYKDRGYEGIVIADHYADYYFNTLGDVSWEKKIGIFLRGYENALERGKELSLSVFLGVEIRLNESWNEYLLFGMDKDKLVNIPNMCGLTPQRLREVTAAHGVRLFQAHPFRNGMEVLPPHLLDGLEVYNGNPRHRSNNELADEYAETNGLSKLSGSDSHQLEDIATGGVALNRRVSSAAELVDEIMSGDVRLIRNGVVN
jgi:hypothetical protein